MSVHNEAITRWEGQAEEFFMSACYGALLGIDGTSMENSTGIVSQDLRHCKCFKKTRMIYKSRTLNLRNSQTGSSSCPILNDIDWTRKGNDEIKIANFLKKSRNTRRDSRRDSGRASVLETKRSGMELFLTHLRENGTLQPLRWWNDSKTQVIQYSRVLVI